MFVQQQFRLLCKQRSHRRPLPNDILPKQANEKQKKQVACALLRQPHPSQKLQQSVPKKCKKESHNPITLPSHLTNNIDVVRTRHPMGSVALPDCSAEAVSKRSQGHAQQIASYLCEWVATTRFEPGTDGWVVANSRGGKKD